MPIWQMDIAAMQARAVATRKQFAEFEVATYGAEWSTNDLLMGLMTDVGDLAAAVQRAEGRRPAGPTSSADELGHEISDCLWVLLVLADKYDVDVANAFDTTMDQIALWIGEHSADGG